MSVRVYVPATVADLAALVAEGRLAGPRPAHAVTDALRAAWPEGDEEELEHAALMAAADASAALRGPGDPDRRVVVAADVAAVEERGGDDPTAVTVAHDVVVKNVASAHVDTADGADTDDELAWFATQEIGDLVSELSGH